MSVPLQHSPDPLKIRAVMTVLTSPWLLGIAFYVHGTPLFYSAFSFSCTPAAPTPLGVAVPTAFPDIRFSSSSRRVMSATASLCGTIVALDSTDL